MTERERLIKVMESEGLTAKQFAQEVGIQPGTISNIVGGRNNPSLDVLQRVMNRYRSLSSDWMFLGVGQMYRPNGEMPSQTLFDIRPEERVEQQDSVVPSSGISTKKVEQLVATPQVGKSIEKIVIFYSDGTFEER